MWTEVSDGKVSEKQYKPTELAEFLSALNDHLGACAQLRRQAYDLAVRAALEALRNANSLADLDRAAAIVGAQREHSGTFLANLSRARLEGEQVVGEASPKYWAALEGAQASFRDSVSPLLNEVVSESGKPGSPFNFTDRVGALRRLFCVEFREVARLALRAEIGVRWIHPSARVDALPSPKHSFGLIDKVAVWARETAYSAKNHIASVEYATGVLPSPATTLVSTL